MECYRIYPSNLTELEMFYKEELAKNLSKCGKLVEMCPKGFSPRSNAHHSSCIFIYHRNRNYKNKFAKCKHGNFKKPCILVISSSRMRWLFDHIKIDVFSKTAMETRFSHHRSHTIQFNSYLMETPQFQNCFFLNRLKICAHLQWKHS